MTRPRPAQPSFQTQSRTTRRWLGIIAEREGRSVRAVAAEYRTAGRLAVAVAHVLRAYCHAEAVRLVRTGEAAPTGDDLVEATIRRYHTRYTAIREAQERRQQDATIATLLARQQAMQPPTGRGD